jgi:hypothetical protein
MNMGRMRRLGVGRGKRRSQGERGEGRVNHDTAPSTKTKRITRLKVRQAQPAYWVQNKQINKMYYENA